MFDNFIIRWWRGVSGARPLASQRLRHLKIRIYSQIILSPSFRLRALSTALNARRDAHWRSRLHKEHPSSVLATLALPAHQDFELISSLQIAGRKVWHHTIVESDAIPKFGINRTLRSGCVRRSKNLKTDIAERLQGPE